MKKNRRDFLKNSTLGITSLSRLSPIGLFCNAITSESFAQSLDSNQSTQYVYFHLAGGPPRWLWDLPLNPNGSSDPLVQNATAITRFNANQLQGEYQTFDAGPYQMPILWDAKIPSLRHSDGIKMASLLKNMMMIRGYTTGSDSHSLNRRRHMRPSFEGPSLSGLAADCSNSPIPAVAYLNPIQFSSQKGLGITTVSHHSPLEKLLSPLTLSTGISPNSDELDSIFNQFLEHFESNIDSRDIKKRTTYQDRLRAKKLFKRNFGDLTQRYNSLYSKYQNLIQTVFTDSLFQIGSGVDSGSFLTKGNLPDIPEAWYLHDLTSDPSLIENIDFTTLLCAETTIKGLAESMAITEFLLTEKLCSSVTNMIQNLESLKFNDLYVRTSNDSHGLGTISTLFLFSKFYQAFTACLHELVETLKDHHLFEDTVIQISGDFNRTARANGSGSDHAWHGSNTSFISGKIDRHMILGNTTAEIKSHYLGSWGKGASVEELGNRVLTLEDVAATAADLIGANYKFARAESLIEYDSNGKVKNRIGAKNV